jgi:hypothetical protein
MRAITCPLIKMTGPRTSLIRANDARGSASRMRLVTLFAARFGSVTSPTRGLMSRSGELIIRSLLDFRSVPFSNSLISPSALDVSCSMRCGAGNVAGSGFDFHRAQLPFIGWHVAEPTSNGAAHLVLVRLQLVEIGADFATCASSGESMAKCAGRHCAAGGNLLPLALRKERGGQPSETQSKREETSGRRPGQRPCLVLLGSHAIRLVREQRSRFRRPAARLTVRSPRPHEHASHCGRIRARWG